MSSNTFAPLAPDAPWVVLKFGGTSVATVERWHTIRELAAARRAEGARVLVVVSALSGVTDALKALCTSGAEARAACLEELVARHHALAAAMGLAPPADMQRWIASLQARVTGAGESGGGADPLWQAAVQAHGELLSSSLGAAFLTANGLATGWLDAREALVVRDLPFLNSRARALAAQVQAEPDPAFAARLAALGEVCITQGFIARNGAGETVLLGRGGSDTSAAYFGALLRAQRVETWTDVAGMFTADPRQVPGARLLRRLDFEEAQEIATTGARVLHARCISPCRRARVPLWIKDTQRPALEGTVIGPLPPEAAPSIKTISSRRGITLVSMETSGMWQQVGFLADVFALFKQHGLSVDLIGSAETNVTVSLDPSENLLDSDVVAALAADLARVCRVKVIAPCAAVTLVGRGMRSMLHRLSGVLAEFGRDSVHLISQSSNNLNLTFVVDEGMLDGLLPRLHELLVRAGALRTDDAELFGPSWQEIYGTGVARVHAPWWMDARARLLEAAQATPRYVYHLPTIRERARALKTLQSIDRIYYAVKANAHPAILRAIAQEGLGLECVSPGELQAVRAVPEAANCPLLFTPNFASRHDYEAAVQPSGPRSPVPGPEPLTPNFASRHDYEAASPFPSPESRETRRSCGSPSGPSASPTFAPASCLRSPSPGILTTLDNLHPLQHWPELFAGQEVVLRVDLGRGIGHHDKVRTGGAASKFGLPLEQLDAFLALAREHDVRVVALHAHLGSGVLDATHWARVCGQLASLADRVGGVRSLNLGGGLGVPAHPGEAELDLAQMDAALAEARQAYPHYELWLEPGRWLVADAGVLLARVTQTKRKGALHYLGCDAGMHALIRPALYDAWHEVVNLSRLDAPADTLYQVVGPICESGDVLGSDRRLPESSEGDVVLIAQAGAYGEAMSSRYNLRPLAESVVLE